MQWAPKQWMQRAGAALRDPGQAAGKLDRAIQEQAAGRALRNERSGTARNMHFLLSQPADTVARRLIAEETKLPGMFGAAASGVDLDRRVSDLAGLIQDEGNRRALLGSGVPAQMKRGPFGQRGLMEAINQGIATNAAVRRGVLPTAVAGGGLLGGAAVTEGAQQLMALMGFMQQGEQTRERAESSPIARA